jgi:hypothetical protein
MIIDDKTIKFYFKDLQPGVDGISPTIAVDDIENGHRITITDIEGTKQINVFNGVDGIDGKNGVDGVSPVLSVQNIENGHKIIITDVEGTKTIDVMNGINGTDGTDGVDGINGISPIISIESIDGGHKVLVEDAEGEKSFDVYNGISALSSTNILTDHLLSQTHDNLMQLVDNYDPTTSPTVRLIGNRITQKGLSSATSSSNRNFLISNNVKYLRTNAASSITADDWITINYEHGLNLYCRVSGYVQSPSIETTTLTPDIIIYTKLSGQNTVNTTTCTFKCGNGGKNYIQFGDMVYPVVVGDMRNSDVSLNIAVTALLHPYLQNIDITLDFYLARADEKTEQSNGINVIGAYNNTSYAEKAYEKNDLIIKNDRLYRTSSNIALGSRIEAGYNLVSTSLSDELKELRSLINGS